jgi:hypothetical protein
MNTDMTFPTPDMLTLKLAWKFSEILPGNFERDRKSVIGRKFPIIAPLPKTGSATLPLENSFASAPFLYFVYSSKCQIKYIGKSTEKNVLERWIRPEKSSGIKRWTHGTTGKNKSTVEYIAEEIINGVVPVSLYFTNYEALLPQVLNRLYLLGICNSEIIAMSKEKFIEQLEHYLIYKFQPDWNVSKKNKSPSGVINNCGDYWIE